MDRFIADKINEKAYIFSKDEINHIQKTLRLKLGDNVEITDGNNRAFVCKISILKKDAIELEIVEEIKNKRELRTQIIVYQGIPKSQKMDLIVQKLTEIGVSGIVPTKFERCVKDISDKEEKQIARWSKIAIEALKQSKRTVIPLICKTKRIVELENEFLKNDINILCYENEENTTIKHILKNLPTDKNLRIGIVIGTEGGITDDEKEMLISFGAKSATLGKTILRTETAAILATSVVAYEME